MHRGLSADARAAVFFALSSYAKAGFDGVTKSRAVAQLAATLDADALQAYAEQLVRAFVTGRLVLEGAIWSVAPLCVRCCFALHLLLGVAGAVVRKFRLLRRARVGERARQRPRQGQHKRPRQHQRARDDATLGPGAARHAAEDEGVQQGAREAHAPPAGGDRVRAARRGCEEMWREGRGSAGRRARDRRRRARVRGRQGDRARDRTSAVHGRRCGGGAA